MTQHDPKTITHAPVPSSRDRSGPARGLRDAASGDTIALPLEATMWIGSHQACTLRIVGDVHVSGWHCRIVQLPDDHIVVYDNRSKNGTHVNGSRVTASTLAVGAVLTVGATSFVVYGPNSERDRYDTPKLDSIVRERVRIYGSERKAAQALGVAKSTLNRWKTPRTAAADAPTLVETIPVAIEDTAPMERPERRTDPRAVPIVPPHRTDRTDDDTDDEGSQ